MRKILTILFVFVTVAAFSQQRKIQLIHSDNTIKDETKYPKAIVALGNVMVEHEGATLACKQALIYQEANIIKAFGDVVINQGDTIIQNSKYVHYDGKTKTAQSWGNVVLTDPKMTLTTDTLHFDRVKQLLFYRDHATIKDSTNTLESQIGHYYLETNKFQALSKVIITNPDNKVTSEHLDYYTDTGISNLYGPSTIEGKDNTLYCEEGFNDSKKRISHFIKNAKLIYQDRIIEGDSLYYDENMKFASATGNIVVTDTINNSIVKGGYSEYFEDKDSVFVVNKPIAISTVENDSTYIHGDTLLVTGEQDKRIIRAYHHVKLFKTDLQGKCDSLISNESTGLTKMYRRPVLWNDVNQITGDTIHFLSDTITEKLDSLKVYNNAFVIKKDSTGGFSQIKGKNLYGKFVKDTLDNIYVLGNGQMINYNRDENKKLQGITKMTCSNMKFVFKKGQLDNLLYTIMPEGKTYPPSKFPKSEEKLPGFIWRENERPITKDDVFTYDEGDDELIQVIISKEREARKVRIEEEKKRIEEERIKMEKEKKELEGEKEEKIQEEKVNRELKN
ncbi:MAG: OstA-like protein [Bacteroidota bacterium]